MTLTKKKFLTYVVLLGVNWLTNIWLTGFVSGVITAFVCSAIFSIVLMMMSGLDEPDPLD